MRSAPSNRFGRYLFWGMMFGLPALFVVAGLLIIVAAWTQTPRDGRLPWAGAFVSVAGVVGLLAASSFRRRALRGEPY
jgi:CDP-diglyceride synthetase